MKKLHKKKKRKAQIICATLLCYFITQVKSSISQHSLPRRVHARNDAS